MGKATVLVTAGFGNQARAAIPRLVAAGFRVRAMRASERSGPGPLDLGAHEVIYGDASNPMDAARALEGVDAVYHVGPTFHIDERAMGMNMIDQAKRAGVRHFVFSSVLHPILTGLPQHAIKRDIEEALVESGLNFTILQPSDYMQMSIMSCDRLAGVFKLGFSLDRRQALVDLEDVADVLVRVLSEGCVHFGATYELTSSDCLTGREIAEALSLASGSPVKAVCEPIDPAQLSIGLGVTDAAARDYLFRTLNALRAWYDRYDFVGNANVLRMLLGREPTSYLACATRMLAKSLA